MHENLFPHHQQTIDRTTDHYRADPNNLALIISGSTVKGLARADSDVDIVLIVSDAEYDRRVAADEFTLYRPDLSTYEGGYVDGKYMNTNSCWMPPKQAANPHAGLSSTPSP